jgi:chorismate mutase/prephenate dehydrogenase
MEKIRYKLDEIDSEIVALIAKRQSLVPEIGKYKAEHKLPITQPKREKAILVSKKHLARELGLKPTLIEKIFKLIMENSREIQKKSQH